MPKLCEKGCSRIAVGRVMVIVGPAIVTHYFCSEHRRLFLKGKNETKSTSRSGTHNVSDLNGRRGKNTG